MRIISTVMFLLVLLLAIAAGLYFLTRHFEAERWAKFKKQYYEVVETGRPPEGERIVWQGKIIDYFPEERLVLLQAYKFKKPTDFMFYAKNDNNYTLNVKKGDWLEVRGDIKGFDGKVPILTTQFFDKWLYLYYDIGLFADIPERLELK
ncbi:MAG: hypothetical protein Kow00107_08520 [Planctomycetota bacterium]